MLRKERLALVSMTLMALVALCITLLAQQSFPLASPSNADSAAAVNAAEDAGADTASARAGSASEGVAAKQPANAIEEAETTVEDAKSAKNEAAREDSTTNAQRQEPGTVDATASNETSPRKPTDEHGTDEAATHIPTQDPADASASEPGLTEKPQFELPEGVEVEPQAAVVKIPEDADLSQLALELEQSLGSVTVDRVTDTYARVAYASDVTVEDAVNRILDSGLADSAQPNYVYHVLSDELASANDTGDGPTAVDTQLDAVDQGIGPTDVDDASSNPAFAQETQVDSAPGIVLDESPVPQEDVPQTAPDAIELVDNAQDIVVEPLDDEAPQADESKDSLVVDQPTDGSGETRGDEDQPALQTQSSTNDPYAYKQWALDSLSAYDAWNYARNYNKVTVATLDLGYQVNHPDLKANIVDPYNAYNAARGRSTTDVSPCNASFDHGSHVAGIIGAVADNGIGIAGITKNAAYIMPIKVVDKDGDATSTSIVKAYDYVLRKRAARNVRVVNLSMGVDARQLPGTNESRTDDAILAKIRQAYAAGIVTVCASGNKNASVDSTLPFSCYPSEDDNVVSVINLRKSGNSIVRSPTSNYNATNDRSKDISAPGTDIYSTVAFGDYSNMSGTSMAAPYVSGVLALEFAVNPKLTPRNAIKILYATATNPGGFSWTRSYGWGMANAKAAVRASAYGMTAAQAAKAKLVSPYLPGGSSTSSSSSESTALTVVKAPTVSYRTHIQSAGWQGWRKNGKTAGTSGKSLRLEAIQIKLSNRPYAGTIQYRTYVQAHGWESSWRTAPKTSGTSGQSKRLEAIRIRLAGNMAKHYDVYYRVHAQHFGWMGWAKNGAKAGTAGYSYRLEGIQIRLVPKGGASPGSTANTFRAKP